MLIAYDDLKEKICEVFCRAGMLQENALLMADTMVTAEARGIYSHGVKLVSLYDEMIRERFIHINPQCRVIKETSSSLLMSGDYGLGGIVMTKAMGAAIKKAKKTGCASVAVNECGHFGAGAYYVELAATQNLIAYVYSNTTAAAVPFGGAAPYLGTNPYSYGAPAGKYGNVVLDMATTVTALTKILIAAQEGTTVPLDYGVDSKGAPTSDPNEILNGGALNHFGGPKGYGIAYMIDMMSGILSGAAYKPSDLKIAPIHGDRPTIGYFLTVIDPDKFVGTEEFIRKSEEMIDDIKKIPTAKGVDEIYFPGEIENRRYKKAKEEGVQVHDVVYNDFVKIALKYGVQI